MAALSRSIEWIAWGIFVCLCFPLKAQAEFHLWGTAQTVRVLRDDLPPSESPPIELAMARNEWRSFQILIRSDGAENGIRLEAGNLNGPSGNVLKADDAVLYRQQQIELTVASSRDEHFKAGWYPDALIPFRNPLTRAPLSGARFTAIPFDLPPHQTHGFWVDIYVPPGAAAGDYRGVYTLTASSGLKRQIPVHVHVWDFELPSTPTLRTSFGAPLSRLRAYYKQRAAAGKEKEPADWNAVEAQVNQFLADHRLNATPSSDLTWPKRQPDGSYLITDDQIKGLRSFIDRYHVNAIAIPKPTDFVDDPVAQKDKLAAWCAAWDSAAARLKRPGTIFYVYLYDEPNDLADYRFVQKWGRAIRQTKTCVKVLVTEQTKPQEEDWGDLYGAVDIWVPLFPLFNPDNAARRQALGETIWCYTALTQQKPTPWWEIDFPLLNYRVPAWIAWRYRMRGLLYWGSLCYWQDVDDPWTDPKTYFEPKKNPEAYWNGEGVLAYPARAVGYDGIVPSIRLKAIRDSIEDYEYFSLLERAGKADDAQRIVMSLSPSWFTWQTDESRYETARRQLGEMILRSFRGHST